ncbi:Translation initiation factor 3 subunit c [Dimargaris verticillata]|uniref:Eukaryotic translation initiation factor 3 subunit C n=1 Tax=Dimargaris verticillata TaxID=2761393 RepID=A0A9W8B4V6_9FUNG|nr:Translation initiation factor 3 subunit c [Dimargaris verticillata]
MSRFFRGGSDSESSSSFSESSYESEVELTPVPQEQPVAGTNRFMIGNLQSESESEEDVKRVVRSAKDKRTLMMRSHVETIANALESGDWKTVLSEFDALMKLISKAGSSILVNNNPPTFFTRVLVRIDDAVQAAAQQKKRTDALTAKSLNAMKQKMRKAIKDYDQAMGVFRQNPVGSSESDSGEPTKKTGGKKWQKGAGDEVASDSWPSDSDSETDESEGEQAGAGINRWLKRDDKAKPLAKKPKAGAKGVAAAPAEAEEDDGFTTVGPKGKRGKERAAPTKELTSADIPKQLELVMQQRGKKGQAAQAAVANLDRLYAVATHPTDQVRILLLQIAFRLDSTSIVGGHMKTEHWQRLLNSTNQLLDLLEANPDITVREDATGFLDESKERTLRELQGSIIALVDRADDEFFKSLQAIDPHTTEYLTRLRDQSKLYCLIARAQRYFESRKLQDSLARAMMRRIEQLYYKPDAVIRSLESNLKEQCAAAASSSILGTTANMEPAVLIHKLCSHLYYNADAMTRTRAILCQIYSIALHDRFHEARDLLLMSHLQEGIQHMDVKIQVLYNRAMVQLGMCAFRQGLISEAYSCLQDLMSTQRQKELLAQGVHNQRAGQENPAQAALERQRQLPFHMHINLELLECVYLTCCMLIEVPAMAQAGGANDQGARKRIISRNFRRMLDFHERQIFTGPPENTRDHILSAARALAVADWVKCKELIDAIRIWDLMPQGAEEVKTMLAAKIQEQGLRTYLFTYAPHYESLALPILSNMFDVPLGRVTRVLSKMIWNEELAASLDQVGELVIFHKVDPSRLQKLGQNLADRTAHLIDNNEKLFEQKTYNSNARDQEGGDDDESGGRRFQRGGRRGGGPGHRGGYRGRGRRQDGGPGGYQGNRNQGAGGQDGGGRRPYGGGQQDRRGGGYNYNRNQTRDRGMAAASNY